jgi:hypothetical protein
MRDAASEDGGWSRTVWGGASVTWPSLEAGTVPRSDEDRFLPNRL